MALRLGYDHINRDEIISHNTNIATALHGDSKAIILFDGTFIYIQKSKNFLFKKITYSLHKFKNFLKPFLLVCTDGYIIDILEPYSARTSDAQIMKNIMNDIYSPNYYVLQENDTFILDRGFRDSIPAIEDLTCHLQKTETQLSSRMNKQINRV